MHCVRYSCPSLIVRTGLINEDRIAGLATVLVHGGIASFALKVIKGEERADVPVDS